MSYSNPVRQSLFVFEDSIGSAANDNYKSVRAAENLKKIYPGVVFKLNYENFVYQKHFEIIFIFINKEH